MQLWKALRYLYPNASPLIDYAVADKGGGQQIVTWNEALGPQPDAAALAAAEVAYDAAQATRDSEAATLRNQIATLAQSAVGVSIAALTAAQVRALIAILLNKEGALNPDGTVKPLAQWVRNGS